MSLWRVWCSIGRRSATIGLSGRGQAEGALPAADLFDWDAEVVAVDGVFELDATVGQAHRFEPPKDMGSSVDDVVVADLQVVHAAVSG
jgi:hypothetical protein